MNDTPDTSVAGRAILLFLCFCGVWIILSHAVISQYWDVESYDLPSKLFADGLFLVAAPIVVFVLLRRAAQDASNTVKESIQWDDRARVAVEAAGDGIWELNAPSPAESYSGEVFSMLGIAPVASNDVFLAFREKIHPDDRPKLHDANASVQKRGHDEFRLKCRIRDNDERWRLVSIRGRCVERLPDGRPARIAGILSDVTDEAKREAELESSRDMLNALLEAIPYPVAFVDANGTLKRTSDSWRRAASDKRFDLWLPPSGAGRSRTEASGESQFDAHEELRDAIHDVLSGRQPGVTLPLRAGEADTPTRPETALRPYLQGSEIAGAVIAMKEVTEDQEQIGTLLRETEGLREENERRQRKIEEFQRKTDDLLGQIDELQPRNAELQNQSDELLKRTEELQRENGRIQDRNEDLEIRITDLLRQIEQLEPAYTALQNRTGELQRQTEELERRNGELETRNEALHDEAQDLALRTDELRLQNDQFRRQNDEFRRRIAELSSQNEDRQRQNDGLDLRLNALQQEMDDLQLKADSVQRQSEDVQRAYGLLKFAVDSSPFGLLAVDEDFRANQLCNAAVESLFGWPADEVLGRRAPMIPQDEEPAFRDAFRHVAQGNEPYEFRAKCTRRDGELRETNFWARSLPDLEATSGAILLVAFDCTGQLARERDEHQAKRDLERIFEHLPHAVAIVEPDSHVVQTCSRAVEAVFGVSPDDFAGRTTQGYYRDEAEYLEFCLWSKMALEANHPFRRTCKMTRRDGQEFEAVQTVVPLDRSDNSKLLMVVVEEPAEIATGPNPARPDPGAGELDLRNLGAMIYRTVNSHDWVLAFANEGARDVTGYAPGAFTQPGYSFYTEIINESDREHVLGHIRDALADVGQFDVRYRIKNAAGELRWVDHQGTVVRSPNGNGEWVEGMIVDITRDMHLRDSLVLHRQQMQALLFHTLQSMERVREGVADRLQRSIAGHLLSSTAALHGVAGKIRKKPLIDDLQNVQKSLETAIEDCNTVAGEMTPAVLDRLGLNAALEYLLRDIRLGHQVQTSLRWTGPTARLEKRLEKYLYRSTEELVQNVFQHAGVSEARVSVRVQDDLIRVAVKDFGKGFPGPDSRPKDRGQRGFGLFMIRECAAHLGGACTVATKRGTGSRVTIEIPLPLATAPAPADADDAHVDLVDESIELHEL